MRRLGALILLAGLCAPAFADSPPPAQKPEDTSVPWYRWLFLGERSKPAAATPTAAAAPTAPKPAAGPTREAVAKMMADEQKVYLERLNAISKIRLVASQQGDEELLKKADDLEAQAEELYKLRTSKLPTPVDDRASLERGRDERPSTAQRPSMRRNTRGGDR